MFKGKSKLAISPLEQISWVSGAILAISGIIVAVIQSFKSKSQQASLPVTPNLLPAVVEPHVQRVMEVSKQLFDEMERLKKAAQDLRDELQHRTGDLDKKFEVFLGSFTIFISKLENYHMRTHALELKMVDLDVRISGNEINIREINRKDEAKDNRRGDEVSDLWEAISINANKISSIEGQLKPKG